MPIRLIMIDDHTLFREGVSRLLAAESDLEMVALCPDLACGKSVLEQHSVDVVLLDFDLGGEQAVDFVRYSRDVHPSTKVLIVTAGVPERSARELVRAGVSGIFHKHNDPQSLSRRIRSVFAGDLFLEEAYLRPLFEMAQPESTEAVLRFTEREQTVLDCLLEGLSNKLIADRLGASESAVKGTIQQLFQKTGVRTRSQLVRIALEQSKS
ncbi:MAG TPA: response regulator transcription factor [Bryobacteraceae bacterium]|nr:response regulator transcription factor [Bryobacteraceae bacterium]HTF71754.1 response regulator transcription factor [Edaphobacter sp.]